MDSPGNLHCANCIDTLLLLRRRCCWRPPLSIDISFRRGASSKPASRHCCASLIWQTHRPID